MHFLGNLAYLSKIPVQDKNIDAFPFSVCLLGRYIPTPRGHLCMFNGSNGERPLPLSKTPKTHPKISDTLHLHVTVHIHHATETL